MSEFDHAVRGRATRGSRAPARSIRRSPRRSRWSGRRQRARSSTTRRVGELRLPFSVLERRRVPSSRTSMRGRLPRQARVRRLRTTSDVVETTCDLRACSACTGGGPNRERPALLGVDANAGGAPALCEPGDAVLGFDFTHGGPPSQYDHETFAGRIYYRGRCLAQVAARATGLIDPDEVAPWRRSGIDARRSSSPAVVLPTRLDLARSERSRTRGRVRISSVTWRISPASAAARRLYPSRCPRWMLAR